MRISKGDVIKVLIIRLIVDCDYSAYLIDLEVIRV